MDRHRAQIAVLVPVKAFAVAKARLAPVLDATGREALARRLAEGVLRAVAPLPVAVVCDDAEVARWAEDCGALVIREPGRGLNGAVEAGVDQLAEQGYGTVAVVHADLARPRGIAALAVEADRQGVTLVPDRRDDGTNVLVVPTRSGFRFAYGPRSFRHHVEEAERLGLAVTVVRDSDLALDVDVPADLAASERSV